MLGFDDYADIAARLRRGAGRRAARAAQPRGTAATLLPLTPVRAAGARGRRCPGTPSAADEHTPAAPAPGAAPPARTTARSPRSSWPRGCDRRCAFCAIPSFRGAFVSRTPDEVLAEAEWLAAHGVRELVLVSENSTSYGKDLGDPRLLEKLLPQLAAVAGHRAGARLATCSRPRPGPALVEAIASTPGVAPYFDLSFQHSSEPVLRRMRRFGSTERFLDLLDQRPRAGPGGRAPGATSSSASPARPGPTWPSWPGSSPRPGSTRSACSTTATRTAPRRPAARQGRARTRSSGRYDRISALAEELCAQRAEERLGGDGRGAGRGGRPGRRVEGRAAHQAPEVDGSTTLVAGAPADARSGDLVRARVTGTEGVDLRRTDARRRR